jgi:hypothetical protein
VEHFTGVAASPSFRGGAEIIRAALVAMFAY